MAVSKHDAFALAVLYNAFNDLDFTKAPQKVWVVASDLIDIQAKTGVELHDNEWLADLVEAYKFMAKHI